MGQTKNFKGLTFTSSIHTLQMTVPNAKQNLSDDEIIKLPFVKKKPYYDSKGNAVYTLNPNKLISENYRITSLKEFKAVMREICKQLNISKYDFKRIDIAVDFNIEFEKYRKLNQYFRDLIADYLGTSNSYKVTSRDLRDRSLVVQTYNYKLQIYNKKAEAKNPNCETRIEFQYLDLKKGYNAMNLIDETINILKILPSYIEQVTVEQAKYLLEKYEEDILEDAEERSLNLYEFTSHNATSIYNRDIMEIVHNHYYSGNLKSWLERYRKKGYNLTFYQDNFIIGYINRIIKSLTKYRNIR